MSTKRPGEVLEALLRQRGISFTTFGQMIGRDYQTVHRWISGAGFDKNKRNQGIAERALGVGEGYFRSPDSNTEREKVRRAVFERFCSTELGQSMSRGEYDTLNSFQVFLPGKAPSVGWYQLQIGLLRGVILPSMIEAATLLNEQADEELAGTRQSQDSPVFAGLDAAELQVLRGATQGNESDASATSKRPGRRPDAPEARGKRYPKHRKK